MKLLSGLKVHWFSIARGLKDLSRDKVTEHALIILISVECPWLAKLII